MSEGIRRKAVPCHRIVWLPGNREEETDCNICGWPNGIHDFWEDFKANVLKEESTPVPLKMDATGREHMKNARVAWDVAGRVCNFDPVELANRISGLSKQKHLSTEEKDQLSDTVVRELLKTMKSIASAVESDLNKLLEGEKRE